MLTRLWIGVLKEPPGVTLTCTLVVSGIIPAAVWQSPFVEGKVKGKASYANRWLLRAWLCLCLEPCLVLAAKRHRNVNRQVTILLVHSRSEFKSTHLFAVPYCLLLFLSFSHTSPASFSFSHFGSSPIVSHLLFRKAEMWSSSGSALSWLQQSRTRMLSVVWPPADSSLIVMRNAKN